MSKDVTQIPRSSSKFHFLAGLSTGILSATLLQPADLLKTRLQQAHSTTLLPTLREILSRPDAFRSLWRGTLPSVIRTGFGSALYFSTLNGGRRWVAAMNTAGRDSPGGPNGPNGVSDGSNDQRQGTVTRSESSSSNLPQVSKKCNMAMGAIARASAGLVLMPVTVIKVRYESSLYAYKSIYGASKAIWAQEGLRGFFTGFGATAVRDAPYAGLYVVFYEEGKRLMSSLAAHTTTTFLDDAGERNGGSVREMSTSKSIPINFLSGVMAAGVATMITNPFDAVKTRLQLMPGKYGNMVVAGGRMVREEGWRSLMDGLGLRMGRKAVSSALAWTLYEELVRKAEARVGDRL